jgi:hypothetical protein
MGLLWSIPWGIGITIATGLMTYAFVSDRFPDVSSRVALALRVGLGMGFSGALLGFSMGTLFSLILMAAEGNKGIAKLSTPRFAVWGALAGAGMSTAFGALAFGEAGVLGLGMFVGAFTALGATCSTTSLLLAKSGDRVEPRPLPR